MAMIKRKTADESRKRVAVPISGDHFSISILFPQSISNSIGYGARCCVSVALLYSIYKCRSVKPKPFDSYKEWRQDKWNEKIASNYCSCDGFCEFHVFGSHSHPMGMKTLQH